MGGEYRGGPRGARPGREAEPPGWLVYTGYAGLLTEAAGRWLGGRWGGTLAQVGIVAVTGGALAFFSRLLVWRAGQKRR